MTDALHPKAPSCDPTKSDLDRLEKILSCAIETRNFEIAQLSTRNNFALVAQGALVAAALKEGAQSSNTGLLTVAAIGIGLSIFQLHMSAGAKFWQVRWEAATERAEKAYLSALETAGFTDPVTLFGGDDPAEIVQEHLSRDQSSPSKFRKFENWLIMRKFSPSRTPIRMAFSLLCIWTALLLFTAYT